ncbi:MAG TPA: response regulator [bacterium]|nr:response regulator [bacterium]
MIAKAQKKTKPRYVLIIEENVHHAELLTEILDRHFAPVVIHTVDTVEDGIEFAGQSDYDLVISAGVVKDVPITESLQALSSAVGGAPIIVISGKSDETLAADLIRRGAAEYLAKTRETLENLPEHLERHLSAGRAGKRRKSRRRGDEKTSKPTPAAIIREVDRLTQQALAIAGPRRRKRGGSFPQDVHQLDQLLGQIQRLRELASKLAPKD